jgi:hypothetical protein
MEFHNHKTDTEVYETDLPFCHLHTEWSSRKNMQNIFNVEASSTGKLKVNMSRMQYCPLALLLSQDTVVVMNAPATL